ncbi:bombyxin B-2 homolog [Anopheles aquasalis]|uniref:bombyxin B-2 homolog n=1 Tax=Anopheles aquasalis TaxID=42839 RepID=UPI00215A74E8|nr:bombyxin B-2 homolog [Anopheles aquasalis]
MMQQMHTTQRSGMMGAVLCLLLMLGTGVERASATKYCGKAFTDAMSFICSEYPTMHDVNKKAGSFFQDAFDPTGTGLSFPIPARFRRAFQDAHPCCRVGCTMNELMSYCRVVSPDVANMMNTAMVNTEYYG